MSLAEDLRTFLLADATISDEVGGARIHKNTVPQDKTFPFVAYFRGGAEYETATDGAAGEQPFRHLWDVEVVSDDVEESETLAGLVRDRLSNHRGAFGESNVQAVLVQDHDDDYLPRANDADAGLHVATIRVQVIPRT